MSKIGFTSDNFDGRDYFDVLENIYGKNIIMIGVKDLEDDEYEIRLALPHQDTKALLKVLHAAIEDVKALEELK